MKKLIILFLSLMLAAPALTYIQGQQAHASVKCYRWKCKQRRWINKLFGRSGVLYYCILKKPANQTGTYY